jgi:hypothetical protein
MFCFVVIRVVVEVLIFVLCTYVDVCVVVTVVVVDVTIFVLWFGSSRCIIVDGWVVVPVVKYQ